MTELLQHEFNVGHFLDMWLASRGLKALTGSLAKEASAWKHPIRDSLIKPTFSPHYGTRLACRFEPASPPAYQPTARQWGVMHRLWAKRCRMLSTVQQLV